MIWPDIRYPAKNRIRPTPNRYIQRLIPLLKLNYKLVLWAGGGIIEREFKDRGLGTSYRGVGSDYEVQKEGELACSLFHIPPSIGSISRLYVWTLWM